MKIERLTVKSCCGKTAVAFKLDSPISKDILPLLIGKGFIEGKHFTAAGMLYVENAALIASGNFGSNILHIKCKVNDCIKFINDFEELLTAVE